MKNVQFDIILLSFVLVANDQIKELQGQKGLLEPRKEYTQELKQMSQVGCATNK